MDKPAYEIRIHDGWTLVENFVTADHSVAYEKLNEYAEDRANENCTISLFEWFEGNRTEMESVYVRPGN